MEEMRKGKRKNERFRKKLERYGIDGTYEYHEDAWGAYFTKRILHGGPTIAILPETSDVMPPSVRINPGLESGLNVIRRVPYRKAAEVVGILEQLFGKPL